MTVELEALATRFGRAALGLESWNDAIFAVAGAVNARIGQIAALDRFGNEVVHVLEGTTPDEAAGFAAERGFDPAINPRTLALIRTRPLRSVREEQFATPDVIARSPIYQRLFRHMDVPTSIGVRLDTGSDIAVAATFQRPRSSGPTREEEARLLEALAPAMAAAVLGGMVLGTTAQEATVAGAEALGGPALVLGGEGNVLSLSPAAEALLRRGAPFTWRRGRLGATDARSDAALRRALAQVQDAPEKGRVLLAFRTPGEPPVVADLCPLPPAGRGLLSGARALLAIRRPHGADDAAAATALRDLFDLTPAEAAIALDLARGRSPRAIAQARGSRPETVRGQIKALFAKTGTHRQSELATTIAALL